MTRHSHTQDLIGTALALCIAASLAVTARADIVQDHGGAFSQILDSSPIGQSFTAIDETIHTISLGIDDMNAWFFPDDHDLTLILYLGDGFSGEVLAVVTRDDVPNRLHGWLDFTFPELFTTTVGQVYTVEIFDNTARWGVEWNWTGTDH